MSSMKERTMPLLFTALSTVCGYTDQRVSAWVQGKNRPGFEFHPATYSLCNLEKEAPGTQFSHL